MKIIAFVKRTLVMAVMFLIAGNNASLWAEVSTTMTATGRLIWPFMLPANSKK